MRVFFAQSADLDCVSIEQWMAGMGQEKRLRVSKLQNERERMLVLTAHRLLCYVLKKTAGFSPSPNDWAKGKYGKPYLKSCRDIHFNISHSGQIAMCALHSTPIGVDIEQIRPISDDVALRIMSEEEKKVYALAKDKKRLFYKIWTMKEAFIKHNGMGLSYGLGKVTICPIGDTIQSSVPNYRFTLIDSVHGYQAAVCTDMACVHSIEWIENSRLFDF